MLASVFKNVKGWKRKSVSFSIVPIFKREGLWEEVKADRSDKVNFTGSLLASLQLFPVGSQLKPRANLF